MGSVIAHMPMSLDGFVEDASGSALPLFQWMTSGDHSVDVPGDDRSFRVSKATAGQMQETWVGLGALVCGRRLFDLTHGRSGNHPTGVPVFVVTHTASTDWAHPDAPFTFVTDGVASALRQAQQVARARTVAIATPDITRQCLDLGLLDGISVDLVPLLLGGGTPFFAGLTDIAVQLGSPTVVEGTGVTHLTYRVVRPEQS